MTETNSQLNCLRCGHCCMTLFLALANVPADKDEHEIGRWAQLHGCDAMRYGDGSLAIRVPHVCTWLQFDPEKGAYECKDYEHRPQVCREYVCKRVMDAVVVDLAKTNGISL